MPSIAHCVLMLFAGTATAAAAAAAPMAQTPRYRVQDLGRLINPLGMDPFDAPVLDINNAGTVVGGGRGPTPVFMIKQGRLVTLPVGNGVNEGRATAINERGDVLAWTYSTAYSGVVYRDGVPRSITAPQGTVMGPVGAMNEAGQVIGQVQQLNGGVISGGWLPFIHDANGSRLISVPDARAAEAVAINDHSMVLGTADLYSRGSRVFVWRDGRTDILPVPQGSGDSRADYYYGVDINNAGQMLVRHETYGPGASSEDFIFQDGHYTRLPLDGGQRFDWGATADINERGWVVGLRVFETPAGTEPDQRAFLYRDGQVHDLDSLLRPRDAQHWQLSEALALNDLGQIIGRGYRDGELRQYLVTPVPEPAAPVLLSVGLGLVLVAARRARARDGAAAARDIATKVR